MSLDCSRRTRVMNIDSPVMPCCYSNLDESHRRYFPVISIPHWEGVIDCNLQLVMQQVTEETARHAGRADIVPTSLDGSRGM